MNFGDWLKKITDDSIPAIAQKAGLSTRTLQHQVKNNTTNLENVIKIAEAYSVNPIRELIDLSYIDEIWARIPDIEGALRLASDTQLTDEILRRLESGSDAYRRPIDELVEERHSKLSSVAGNVTPLPHTDVLAPLPDLENLDYVAQHDTDQPTNDEYAEHHNEP